MLNPTHSFKPKTNRFAIIFGLIQVLGLMDTSHRFIESHIQNHGIGVLVEFGVSDPALVKSSAFAELAKRLAMQIAAMAPASVGDLLQQPFVFDLEQTVDQVISQVAGPKSDIAILRYVYWSTSADQSDPDPPRAPAVIVRFGNAA